jgi:PAS domain S-box-containing protein
MFEQLKRFIMLPAFINGTDRTRTAIVLHQLLHYCFIFCGFEILGAFFIFEKKVAAFAILALLLTIFLLTRWFSERKHLVLACLFLVISLWTCVTLVIWYSGGINSVAVILYLLVIVLSGALLGQMGTIFTALLSAIAGGVLLFLHMHGLQAPTYFPIPPPARFITWIAAFVLITPMINLTISHLNRSLQDARNEIAERKKIEHDLLIKSKEALEASERYRSYIHVSHTAAWEFSVVEDQTWISPEFFEMLGYPPDEAIALSPEETKQIWYERTHPDDLQMLRLELELFVQKDRHDLFEQYFRIKDIHDKWLWILARGKLLFGPDGAATGQITGAFIDSTEQKLNEQKILEQALFIKKINEQSPDLIYIYDLRRDSSIYINKDIAAYLGYAKGELPEDSIIAIRQIIHPDDLVQFENYSQKAQHFRDDYILEFEYRLLAKNGEWRWFTGNEKVFESDTDGVYTLLGTVREVTEKKEIDKQLLIYKQALETSQDAMYLITRDGRFTPMNTAACGMLGYTEHELSHLYAFDVDPHYDATTWEAHWMDLKKNKALHFESVHRKKSGEFIPVELNISFIILDGNEYDLAFVRDISERKAAEEALRTRERQLSYAFTASTDGFWEWNFSQGTTYYSPRWYEMLGYSPSLISPGGIEFWQSLCHPDDVEKMVTEINAALHTTEEIGFKLETRFRQFNGDWIWILSRGKVTERDDAGEALIMSGTFTDITERKTVENSLRESEERFALAFRSSAVAVSITTWKEGRYVLVNDEFCRISGYQLNELIGRTSKDISIWENHSVRDFVIGQLLSVGFLKNAELNIRTKAGEIRTGMLSADIIKLGVEKHIIITYHDITDRKIMERALIAAKEKAEEMSRIKSSFLANMSHELRTPMIGILGYSEILHDSSESPQMKKMAETINRSGLRLMKTLNMILDLSRIESGKQEVRLHDFDVVKLTADVCKLFDKAALKKNLSLIFTTEEQSLILRTDEKLYREIFNNLINNAIKFTEEGTIRVSMRIRTKDNQNSLVVTVEDSGIGIAGENLDIIFEEFRQASEGIGRSFEGTGLGLTITKRFVDKLGGSITVESELDKGTIFTVSFPMPSLV